MSYFVELLVNFREKGFPEVIEEICDAMNAKNVQLEEEKAEELSSSLLEKIPECPVTIKLHLTKCPPMFYLLLLGLL